MVGHGLFCSYPGGALAFSRWLRGGALAFFRQLLSERPIFPETGRSARIFSGAALLESVELVRGGISHDFSGFLIAIVVSAEPAALEEGGILKGTDPKNTVEMMLASTLPLVGQR